MIVCKQCGHHNEDNDTFCGSCGKFLEWSGERVAVAEPEPRAPAVEAEPEPEPARLGLFDRVKHAVGLEETAPNPATAAGPSDAPLPPPAPMAARSSPTAAAAPAATPIAPAVPLRTVPVNSSAYAPTNAAEPVLAGVASPLPSAAPTAASPSLNSDEPLSRRPTSVAPAIARPRTGPRTMEQPTRRHPGDLICGQCGEGNDPTRHFCRRCGSELAEAVVIALPWYRRLLNRVFPGRKREAGWRPKRVGAPNVTGMFMRVVRLAIVALLLVGLLAFVLVPPFHNLVVAKVTSGFTALRKTVHPNFDPVYPVAASATSSTPAHPAKLAIDRTLGTYWAASAADKAPVLVLQFSGPVDLAEIGFTSGASGTSPNDAFLGQPRPHLVHLVFSNRYTTDISLSDKDAAQFNPIDAKQVTSVEIHVMSVYAPVGPAPSAVTVTEVEFKTKD